MNGIPGSKKEQIRRILTRLFGVFLLGSTVVAYPVGPATAASREVGVLVAERRSLVWHPATGDSVVGSHDDLGLLPEARTTLAAVFTDSGLVVGGELIAPSRVAVAAVVESPDRAVIRFAVTDSVAPDELLWGAGRAVAVAVDEFRPGSVVAFDGPVSIRGEVAGVVIALGGDVTIGEAAAVRGDVIVIGGVLRQRGDAKVYGAVFAPGGHRRPRLSVMRAWEFEESGTTWAPTASYDRVDGLRGGMRVGVNTSPYGPRFSVWGAYATASKTWQYRFAFHQRVARKFDLEAHGEVFRLTDTEDEPWVARTPNTMYALVAGSDYRDYYGADGGQLGLTYKYRERGILAAEYRNVDYRRLDAHPELWHLFRPDHDFRANFSTVDPDGSRLDELTKRSSALTLRMQIEPNSSNRPESGFDCAADFAWEIAGGGLGGDYDYDRASVNLRGWWRNSGVHQVAARLFYGAGRRTLPINKLFYLGGVGSLPGYPQKSFSGDEACLFNIEYRFTYWTHRLFDNGVILFFDIGRAEADERFWDLDEFKPDIGIGVDFGEGFRIDVAKGLDRTDRDPRVSVRLTPML